MRAKSSINRGHRFGVTFHRKLRNKSTLASELDNIEGVGPTRKKNLLKAMGSLKRVKQASIDELSAVAKIGPELAAEIYTYFHKEK